MSNIERSDDSGPIFVRLDGVYFQRCAARPVGTQERPVEVVPAEQPRGAVARIAELEAELEPYRKAAARERSADRQSDAY
jgi:hypothetical protein